ncbi:MAG: hypothetical protein MUO78_02730 [candidate division Zixibacteria bacterium]|nr:hypothetical protein [candidate division Zixibacteria bacterium]
MATIIKTWDAAVELAVTDFFGGAVADLAADQAYDYTGDVDLETHGNQGGQVLVETMLNYGDRSQGDPVAPNDLIVDVFASLDGTVYDNVPYMHFVLSQERKNPAKQFSFIVMDLAHFRIGLKTTGTEDTFDYRITHQVWILTNA